MIRVFLDSLADYASGVYNPIEYAGVTALDVFFSRDVAAKQGRWYQERRDAVVPVLERKGWTVYASGRHVPLGKDPCKGLYGVYQAAVE